MIKSSRLVLAIFIIVLALATLAGCVRPTVEQASGQISIESAPFIIEFRNSGWLDGAIFAQSYEVQDDYVVVTNYYDRKGLHKEVKFIPIDWIIVIKER